MMMKSKTNNLIIITSAMLFCYTVAIYSEPIEILFKHREYLKQWITGCRMASGNQHLLLFGEIDQKEFDYWKKNKDEIINTFVELCHQQTRGRINCLLRRNHLRLEAIDVDIFINILSDLPRKMDDDIEYILKRIPYPYLNNHRAMIIDILKKGDNIDRFSYLAAVIDPPADMKKKLLASDKLSTGLRARLGDKKHEDELVQKVNNYTGDKNIGGLVNELFLCGTNECLKAALELFAKYKPLMNQAGDCAVGRESYYPYERGIIIQRFRMYHPDLPLLHLEYNELDFLFANQKNATSSWGIIIDYMEKFVKWGNAEYGANAKLDNWFLFPGQCEPIASRERRVRERKADPNHEKLMRENSGYRMGFTELERELESLKRSRGSKK
jgi:hypothetical protein